MDTKSIVAELEDLGAVGNKPVMVARVEEVRVRRGSPPPVLLDARGEKMVRLADIVIGELDTLVVAASAMRDALTEMRDIWKPAITEDAAEDTTEPLSESEDEDDPKEEDLEVISEELEGQENLQGTPNSMGDISLAVPAPVPLPEHLSDLPEHG